MHNSTNASRGSLFNVADGKTSFIVRNVR